MTQFSVYFPLHKLQCTDVTKILGSKYVFPSNPADASGVGLFANDASSWNHCVFVLFLNWSTDICTDSETIGRRPIYLLNWIVYTGVMFPIAFAQVPQPLILKGDLIV